jgi:hypothetical protein
MKQLEKFMTIFITACITAGIVIGLGCCCKEKLVVNGHGAEYWHQRFLDDREELLLWRDVAHMYWQFQDYDYLDDKTWEPVGRHNFWDDCISETQTYDMLDSIQQGDWEDFYAEW